MICFVQAADTGSAVAMWLLGDLYATGAPISHRNALEADLPSSLKPFVVKFRSSDQPQLEILVENQRATENSLEFGACVSTPLSLSKPNPEAQMPHISESKPDEPDMLTALAWWARAATRGHTAAWESLIAASSAEV